MHNITPQPRGEGQVTKFAKNFFEFFCNVARNFGQIPSTFRGKLWYFFFWSIFSVLKGLFFCLKGGTLTGFFSPVLEGKKITTFFWILHLNQGGRGRWPNLRKTFLNFFATLREILAKFRLLLGENCGIFFFDLFNFRTQRTFFLSERGGPLQVFFLPY